MVEADGMAELMREDSAEIVFVARRIIRGRRPVVGGVRPASAADVPAVQDDFGANQLPRRGIVPPPEGRRHH